MADRVKGRVGGIDWFRMAAAVLVIANHTSPLASFSGTADFILTRILARVAVPFFLMASGYFLLPRVRAEETGVLGRFLKRTGGLYGISVLLYLPVRVYQGYFSEPELATRLWKDLLFNGAFYHLWYLPAAMLGMGIAALLLKRLSWKGALAAGGGLYLLGMLGDSWYGLTVQIPALKGLYDGLFACFDYTRNGFFLAPVFLILGGMLAEAPVEGRLPGWRLWAAGGVALGLLLAEGLLLRAAGWPRHDSMYLTLPLLMALLFSLLLRARGQGGKELRTASMVLYLVHPLCIILIRGAAKVTGTEALFIQNSMGHFLAVTALSAGCAAGVVWLSRLPAVKRLLSRRKKPVAEPGRAWIEVDLSAVRENVAVLQGLLPVQCRLMAVVKADAYGHGAGPVCRALERAGVQAFAVATAAEGAALRKQGVRGTILVLGWTSPAEAAEASRKELTLTVADSAHANALDGVGVPLRVHLALDTGMHRLGIPWDDDAAIRAVYRCRNLRVEGTFSHLGVCDSLEETDADFTREQIRRFFSAASRMERMGCPPGKLHLQSSYGVLNDRGLPCDYARVGIALYGALGGGETAEQPERLRPVLALRARVALVREIAAGEAAGYGRAFQAERPTRLAVITIGYADGIPRTLRGGRVLIGGEAAPIVGRVCMDQLLADVTGLSRAEPGMTATLIGRDGEAEISASELALAAGTIPNELLSRLGPRLGRKTSGG